MKRVNPSSLIEIIARHPWTSLRDGVLLSALMSFAVLIARRYDVFAFIKDLAAPHRDVSPAEAVALAVLFGLCVWTFVVRRLRDEACDAAHRLRLEREMSELRELAMQDPLTHLPNRRALLVALEAATGTAAPGAATHAFFLLDLNGFKRVNDLCGHAVGDHVLQVVVERFRRATRPSDVLARLGGDEFALLSDNVDREAAIAIGNRFLAALKAPIAADGHTHELGVAIGAALIPDDGTTVETILRHADLAMYRAKEQEGSALAFFDRRLDAPRGTHTAAG